jgi:hypothetical protein
VASPFSPGRASAACSCSLFNFVFFALFLLYASRYLHVAPATIGLVLGVAAAGTLVASALTGRIARAIGVGPAFLVGCFLFPAPLLLVPAARGPHWLVIAFLFTAEFKSGIGLMLLDILAGSDPGRSDPAASPLTGVRRVHGRQLRRAAPRHERRRRARIGVHATIWIGAGGALLGLAFLLPSRIRHLHDVPDREGHRGFRRSSRRGGR